LSAKFFTTCSPVVLVHEPYIEYFTYKISIVILTPDTLFESITFTSTLMNSKFTLFELWFRSVFILITIILLIVFTIKLKPFSFRDWSLEQKWTGVLLVALLLFNNPVFPIEILTRGWFPQFLDIIFTVTFIFVVLLFILVIIDGVKLEERERTFKSFYLTKLLLIGLLWISAISVLTWAEYNEILDPTVTVDNDSTIVTLLEVCVGIALLSYLFWITYSTCRAFSMDNKKAFLKRRIRFFLFFSLLVVLIIVLGILFDAYQHPNNAAEFLVFTSISNLYVYVLAIVYLPSKDQDVAYTRDFNITTLEDDDDKNEKSNSNVGIESNDLELKSLSE